jgi:4-hydroxybenzoate polyprenyltransferase
VTAASLPALPKRFATLVKIEHTVFALPFAYVGAILCLRSVDKLPSGRQILWITVAMVGARSLAMALNRLIDREIDARNPRTASRELPSGQLQTWQVLVFCGVSLAVFLVAVFQLAHVVRYLWPIPVLGFVLYPYLKRVTWLCHVWLGIVDGLAAVGAWVAVTGHMPWQSWALGGSVALWIAGFDLFYALFDREIDLQQGLHSWATRFGVVGSFVGARLFHLGAVALLVVVGLGLDVGALYWCGVAAVAALLLYEHTIVSPRDLRRLNAAFFTVNGVLSVMFFAFVLADATL